MRKAMLVLAVLGIMWGHRARAAEATADRQAQLETRFVGPKATSVAELEPYTGLGAVDHIVGDARKRAVTLNHTQLRANYGETVDFQLRGRQVIVCPQTIEVLYSAYTPATTRYVPGSRPELERVVAEATKDCATGAEKALALMRYCRDLYKDEWYGDGFERYVYGGTEEELIAKGEILCECLGRLHVALCEIAGLPGRVVMHVIGGHICSEIKVDGGWAYIDPRCGVYFRKPDGALASVWELMLHPEWLRAQSDEVKADVSRWFTWEERAWKCEHYYFTPDEVNAFENYSLADSSRYAYAQTSMAEAKAAGLFTINKDYTAAIHEVFNLEGDGYRHAWGSQPLRKIPIAYRQDGFSMFFVEPPLTKEELLRNYVEAFENTNANILVWGLGPGSVFCFDTKVGEIFGEGLTAEQTSMIREGDRWVHQNVRALIESGNDPLRIACERAHELGLKVFARLEMNHEYGPASDDNWMWVCLVGSLNKNHPEYRIPNGVFLDFKHPEVRAFKLAIFREALEAGSDGLCLDLAVYPPFFEDPVAGTPIMTAFVREVRALCDEFAAQRDAPVEIMARVPARAANELGLDWQTWMREKLINYITPTHYRPNEKFDIEIGEFISMRNRTGVKVVPTIWQALGFVDTDEQPSDDASSRRRYSKPKTPEMFNAQALLFHRANADGIQLGFAQDEWVGSPWLNNLADPEKMLYADKHYMVDILPHCPVTFALAEEEARLSGEKTVPLRIADDTAEARAAGHAVAAKLVLYATPLRAGETLSVYVNGQGPAMAEGTASAETAGDAPLDAGRIGDDIFDKDWWRRGEQTIPVDASWWRLGTNELRFVYGTSQVQDPVFTITWIDLLLDYNG